MQAHGLSPSLRLPAMIIGLALICLPVAAWPQASGTVSPSAKWPDAVTFAVRLENGDVSKAREWLDAGLPPNFMGSRLGTGLMIGAWEGNIPLMALFLERGGDINLSNANGETAVALAAWRGKVEAVRWLLEKGAKLNQDDGQWSALHYATFAGHRDLSKELISRGAEVNARSPNGSSVLMMAIYEGHEDLVKLLLENGADRSIKNDWDDGALEWAMRGNRLKIARMITSPEEFNIAVAAPKEKWGQPVRSMRSTPELDALLRQRDILQERGMATRGIDDRIAAERARLVRIEMGRMLPPTPQATSLDITASRKQPEKQSANVVYGPDGKAVGYKVPPATFTGKPRMPVKGPTRNY